MIITLLHILLMAITGLATFGLLVGFIHVTSWAFFTVKKEIE